MKVVSAEEIQAIDRETIQAFGIPGFTLMEMAGLLTVKVISEHFALPGLKVLILCGAGNNGGDGFVIGRHLHWLGSHVRILFLGTHDRLAGDASTHYRLLSRTDAAVETITGESDLSSRKDFFEGTDIIIDALLGTGLKKDLTGLYAHAVELVNSSGKKTIAVDIPSGIDATTGHVKGTAVKAHITVTMGLPKTGQLIYPGALHCGTLHVANIGFPPPLLKNRELKVSIPSPEQYSSWIPRRSRNAHKGSSGKVLILAGSRGYTGAAALACESCLRTGAGLVTAAIPESLNAIMEEKLTETITLPYPDLNSPADISRAAEMILSSMSGCRAAAIGPGTGQSAAVQKLLLSLVHEIDIPAVFDADALFPDIIGDHRSPKAVLTPHPGEMARLMGISIGEVLESPLQCALKCAGDYRATVILKGSHSIIATPAGEAFFNLSGNEGMATAGMGDVLTGIIAALMAQGAGESAVLGAFMHGLAGDCAAEVRGKRGLLASDLPDRIPEVFRLLEKEHLHELSRFIPLKEATVWHKASCFPKAPAWPEI